MKALASAEKEKKEKVQLQQETDAQPIANELSLAPKEEILPADALETQPYLETLSVENVRTEKPLIFSRQKKSHAQTLSENNRNQQAAANMFTAAQLPKSHFKHVLFALGFVAIGLMVWLGSALLPYQQTSQPVLTNKNFSMQVDNTPNTPSKRIENDSSVVFTHEQSNLTSNAEIENNDFQPQKNETFIKAATGEKSANVPDLRKENGETQASEALISTQNPSSPNSTNQPTAPHALNLISQKQSPSVDPTLLSAYQAFHQGQLTQAQQQYRQVLQKDVRNIDALLGMAAIAEIQGRNADAIGWYQKVLEIEPNHTIATTAILNMQTQTDATSQISRLKNLIAQQPESASLHASLGNAYAQQNDWLSAQAAYFEATRFAPSNADYAFNLAVSLEHLGKPAIALLQYQRALMLVQQSGAQSPDLQILKTRINTLQQ